ncbi:MAG: DUF4912 domain-containing protein [Terriglobia bacterium]
MSQRDSTKSKRGGRRRKLVRGQKVEISKVFPGLPIKPSEFPHFYEHTRVVLLPVNPYLVHVYWEVPPHDLKEIKKLLGRPALRAQPVLRFRDITSIIFDGTNAHSHFDVDIDLGAGNWYVHLWGPAKSYCVDLGLRTNDGQFHPLARSNIAQTPRARPSGRAEETYMLVEGDYHRVEAVPPPAGHVPGPVRMRPESSGAAESAEIGQRPAEPYSLQDWRQFVSEPEQGRVRNSESGLNDDTDLTAMNERSFLFGMSSGKMASREENTGPSDR